MAGSDSFCEEDRVRVLKFLEAMNGITLLTFLHKNKGTGKGKEWDG